MFINHLRLQLLLLLAIIMNVAFGSEAERVFSHRTASDGLWDNKVQQILQLDDGRMFITTIGNINVYNCQKVFYIHKSNDDYICLPGYEGFHHVYMDNHNRAWIKDRNILRCVDLTSQIYLKNLSDIFRKKMKVYDKIIDLFVDSEKHLWLYTDKGLLNTDTHKYFHLPTDKGRLLDIDVVGNNVYVFFSKSVVACFNMNSSKMLYADAYVNPKDASVYCNTSLVKVCNGIIYQAKTDNPNGNSIWLKYNPKTKETKILLRLDYGIQNFIFANNTAYVTSGKGYFTFDLRTEQMKEHVSFISLDDGTKRQFSFSSVCVDHQGGLWLGTYGYGLFYSKPYATPFKHYKYDDPYVAGVTKLLKTRNDELMYKGESYRSILKDERGWVWLGTVDGLKVFKPGSKKPRLFYTEDGLSNNVIYSIIEDDNHNIWMGTGNGITFAHVKTANLDSILFIRYDEKCDNIRNIEFTQGAIYKMKDGRIAVMGSDGWTVFAPWKFHTIIKDGQKSNPGMILSPLPINLYLNGVAIKRNAVVEGNRILKKSIAFTDTIVFNSDQNTFQILYTASNYFRPQQTCYRYRLMGSNDESWHVFSFDTSDGLVDNNGVFHLSLSNVPSGTYKLEVMASMFPNIWEGGISAFTIIVKQNWWTSNILFIIVVMIILILSLANIVIYRNNLKMKYIKTEKQMILLARLKEYISRCDSNAKLTYCINRNDMKTDDGFDLTDEDIKLLKQTKLLLLDDVNVTVDKLLSYINMDENQFTDMVLSLSNKSIRKYIIVFMLNKIAGELKQGNADYDNLAAQYYFSEVDYMKECFYQLYHCAMEEYASRNE